MTDELSDPLEALRQALCMTGSGRRAEILVKSASYLTDDEVRDVLVRWWSLTEAWSTNEYLRAGMFELLRRAAPIAVNAEGESEPWPFAGETLKIYRGNLGEDPALGYSWSLNHSIAEWFAQMCMGRRGATLGIRRDDGVPTTWEAEIEAKYCFGYFNDRAEEEIVVDPAHLKKVERMLPSEALAAIISSL